MQDSRFGRANEIDYVTENRRRTLSLPYRDLSQSLRAQVLPQECKGVTASENGTCIQSRTKYLLYLPMRKVRDRRLDRPMAKTSLTGQNGLRQSDCPSRTRGIDEHRYGSVAVLYKGGHAEIVCHELQQSLKKSACDAAAQDVVGIEQKLKWRT